MTQVVVVAPHPDDEVLGCSGLLCDQSVTVIHVTDGVPPWTPPAGRDELRVQRQAECARAWDALSSRVTSRQLGFADLFAWRAVPEICRALVETIGSLDAADVFLPAYQGGHPDHDATYLAGAMARRFLPDGPRWAWHVYGLYGLDQDHCLRFGWLPPDRFGPTDELASGAEFLEAKASALRQFSSQVWPGSALDQWLQRPSPEQVAPLPAPWEQLPELQCFYDERLNFGRYGASAAAVRAAFQRALAAPAT